MRSYTLKWVCLRGIFQSGGSEDVVQLLEDWWSESRSGREEPCSPGGAEPVGWHCNRMSIGGERSLVVKWAT